MSNTNNEDFFVDDVLSDMKNKKKKVDGKRKGNRTERNVVKVLNDRFGTGFSRSIGSGNRWSQTSHLPKHAQDVFSGDLVCPQNFSFCIESKGGYDDIDVHGFFNEGNSQIDEFIKQAELDSERCGRKPLLIWKKNRKPYLAFIKESDLPHKKFNYYMNYKNYIIVNLEELMKLEDGFFFIN